MTKTKFYSKDRLPQAYTIPLWNQFQQFSLIQNNSLLCKENEWLVTTAGMDYLDCFGTDLFTMNK